MWHFKKAVTPNLSLLSLGESREVSVCFAGEPSAYPPVLGRKAAGGLRDGHFHVGAGVSVHEACDATPEPCEFLVSLCLLTNQVCVLSVSRLSLYSSWAAGSSLLSPGPPAPLAVPPPSLFPLCPVHSSPHH